MTGSNVKKKAPNLYVGLPRQRPRARRDVALGPQARMQNSSCLTWDFGVMFYEVPPVVAIAETMSTFAERESRRRS
jgi:hypothetical protein